VFDATAVSITIGRVVPAGTLTSRADTRLNTPCPIASAGTKAGAATTQRINAIERAVLMALSSL
jgi:hypothetical protein